MVCNRAIMRGGILEQGIAQALGNRPFLLAVKEAGIDDAAAIAHRQIIDYRHPAGQLVHLHPGQMHGKGKDRCAESRATADWRRHPGRFL